MKDLKISYALNDLEDVAKQLINSATSKVIVFDAEMGMGKTTLIKALVKALGSNDEVSSPTYSLVNEYELEDDIIYHFDLYRLQDIVEAYDFGIEDYLHSNHWIFIEWPNLVLPLLPENYNVIVIKTDKNMNRILEFKC